MFNVGATKEITILALAERIMQVTGSDSEISFIPYEVAYGEGFEDMYRRVPDIAKLQGADRLVAEQNAGQMIATSSRSFGARERPTAQPAMTTSPFGQTDGRTLIAASDADTVALGSGLGTVSIEPGRGLRRRRKA